jgi:NAD(P) transhydrogenase subunit alpha
MHEATGVLEHLLLVIAVMFGTINVVGGFLVTDRMLEMFKRKPEPAEPAQAGSVESAESSPGAPDSSGADPGSAGSGEGSK